MNRLAWESWFRDKACASYLGASLFGLILALVMSHQPKVELLQLFYCLSIMSFCSAFAWRTLRLQSTEWVRLVPGFYALMIRQSLCFALLVIMIELVLAVALIPASHAAIAVQGASWFVGLSFVLLTLYRPKLFFISILLFFCLPLFAFLTKALPLALWWLGVSLLWLVLMSQLRLPKWQAEGISIFRGGMDKGMLCSTRLAERWPLSLLQGLNRWLHPISFFMGGSLGLVIALTILAPFVLLPINQWTRFDYSPAVMGSQFAVICCLLVHWHRMLRWQSVEMLMLLPGFEGIEAVRQQFCRQQWRLLWLLTCNIAIAWLVQSWWQAQWHWLAGLHVVLATIWGCAAVMALGCIFQRTWQRVVLWGIYLVHSGCIAGFYATLSKDDMVWGLALDSVFVVISLIALQLSGHRLWSKDVLQPE